MTGALIRKREDRQAQREGDMKVETEIVVNQGRPGATRNREARRTLPWSLQREDGPADTLSSGFWARKL